MMYTRNVRTDVEVINEKLQKNQLRIQLKLRFRRVNERFLSWPRARGKPGEKRMAGKITSALFRVRNIKTETH